MKKSFTQRFREYFNFAPALPVVTESSTLESIATAYPHLFEFLKQRYGIASTQVDRKLTLGAFCDEHALPPAQIVFMEMQMTERTAGVRHLSAREAKQLLEERPETILVDAREEWEIKICKMERSRLFTEELVGSLDRKLPVLVYCHFGVRSFNAATLLKDAGFEQVHVLQGGIEAWSLEIDPSIPRYEAAYC